MSLSKPFTVIDFSVMPAKAGIQLRMLMDSRFRGNDTIPNLMTWACYFAVYLMKLSVRKNFSQIWLALVYPALFFLATGCSAGYQVRDVIDLPPPRRVQAERLGGKVTVRWQAGLERRAMNFSGYLLFMATRSLITTPVHELPPPLVLPDTSTAYSFPSAETDALFIHLRSRAGNRAVSLPSLPEVIVSEEK
jgi:hypothetical protein